MELVCRRMDFEVVDLALRFRKDDDDEFNLRRFNISRSRSKERREEEELEEIVETS